MSLNNDRHSFLALTDCKLRSVKTFILLGYGVKIDFKSVGKLAYCNGNSACAEIVTALDKTAGSFIAEKSLKLAFFRCVTFLHLCTAGLKGRNRMRFR